MLDAVAAPAPGEYRRREPQQTILYETVRRHARTMFAEVRERHPLGYGLPAFVEHEFMRFLDCGVLARGFVRVQCGSCGHDRLVAFSCKNRGLCPSCTSRRMSDTAAHLVDRVLPDVPYRQWVLSLPRPLRFLLAYRPPLLRPVLNIFLRAVFAWQRRKARRAGVARGRPGAVTFVQHFGSSLNLNVHFHALLPDGVFARAADGAVSFVPLAPPSDDEILAITIKIYRRVTALVAKVEDAIDDSDDASAQLYADAVRPQRRASQPTEARMLSRCCALVDGFSLHANVHVGQGHATGLEMLCRYGARPPLALARLSALPDGRILYRFKRALPDGTDHFALPPTEFLRKLAAIVPPPRIHLVRYHGVFAPNAKDRPQVIPVPLAAESALSAPPVTLPPRVRERRLDWAALLRRTFAIDVLQCPLCDGRMKIIAFINDPLVARRILDHLGLPSARPPPEPARAPPEPGFNADPVYDEPA